MLIRNKFEFRGFTSTSSQNGNTNYYINVEDENGESCKLYSAVDGSKLEKGKKYDFILDYSTKYGSLKIKEVK